MTSPDPFIRPSFLCTTGGAHEPRWQQRGGRAATRTHARTGGPDGEGGHAIFHALLPGATVRPARRREQLF